MDITTILCKKVFILIISLLTIVAIVKSIAMKKKVWIGHRNILGLFHLKILGAKFNKKTLIHLKK